MWWKGKRKNGFRKAGLEKTRRTEKVFSTVFLVILLLAPVVIPDLPARFGLIRGTADSSWMTEEKPDCAGEEEP